MSYFVFYNLLDQDFVNFIVDHMLVLYYQRPSTRANYYKAELWVFMVCNVTYCFMEAFVIGFQECSGYWGVIRHLILCFLV